MTTIEVSQLRKSFGGIVAVGGVDLQVARGSIHAVVGENGAGKSTLMKMLAGAERPDSGTIAIDGEPIEFGSARAARASGISIVYQELSILPERPVLANLFVDHQPTRYGFVSRRRMRELAQPVLDRLGLDVDPDTPVGRLTIGERQLVELARALLEKSRVLILDEPNSALNDRETRRLFAILRDLAAEGITILYVSHRLEEVFDIADRVTVMRDGRDVLTGDIADLTIPDVVEAMVGAKQAELFPPRPGTAIAAGEPGLVVDGLAVGTGLVDVSFEAEPGEIVGLAGLDGAGVGLLLGALFGTRRPTAGTVTFPDGGAAPSSPTAAARRQVCLVPSDRKAQGLMLDRSVGSNVVQVAVGAMRQRNPWLAKHVTNDVATVHIDRLGIKTAGPDAAVASLSGGNQQKVVLAKWLEVAPRVVLLDDPTRGVDVGAKHEIYVLVRALADAGRIVLLRSTELPELVGLADRILVFYRGRLVSECAATDVDSRDLLRAINTGSLTTSSALDHDGRHADTDTDTDIDTDIDIDTDTDTDQLHQEETRT